MYREMSNINGESKRFQWPENLSVGILPGLPLTGAKKWTTLLAEDTGVKIHFACTTDTADIIGLGADEAKRVLEGDGRYANRDSDASQIRLVWVHSKYFSGFMTRGDSNIDNVFDIKPGVKVVDMRRYLGNQYNIEGLLAWARIYDLEKDVTWVKSNSIEEKAQLIIDGKADIAWAIPTSPLVYEAEKNPRGLRWLDLNEDKDPEGARRFNEKYICNFSPMFKGVSSCIGHWGMACTGLFCCRADADPEFTYRLAKWSDENYLRYKGLQSWLTQAMRESLMEELYQTFIPCHDGLIIYLKELGLWSDAHEERQKVNVALVDRYCKASQKALRLADDVGLIVSANNPEWLRLWKNYKKEQGLPNFDYLPSIG